MRFLDLIMAALFAFAASLQFNDPDPVQWVVIYAAACALSLMVALRRRLAPGVFLLVAAIATLWAALIALRVPSASEYRHMFDAWEMKSPSIEEAREASGLVIVAAWMFVLFIRSRRAPLRA